MTAHIAVHITRRVSRLCLAVAISIGGTGCSVFPRWSYLAETRVAVETGSDGFSAEEIQRAEHVSADVAEEIGMKAEAERYEDLELERMISARQKPPRRFLSGYEGKMRFGLPIELRLEISDDGRTLYFSLSDYERGTPSPTVTRVRKLMMARTEAAFPNALIVHEAQSLGPFFDLHP